MTTTMQVYGTLLAAAPATRELRYRLLPFGEPGRTNRGTVTVAAGVVALPADPSSVLLNVSHDPERPVGRAVSIVEDPTGLDATFRIAATRAGDDLLAEAAEGLRTGVSVELDGVVIRDGALTAGALTGAGAVITPAFPSAQLVAADTPDDGDQGDGLEPEPDDVPAPDAEGEAADGADTPTTDPGPGAATTEDDMTDTTTLTAAAAPASIPGPTQTQDAPATFSQVTRLLAQAAAGDRSPELLAALADITLGGTTHTGGDALAPSWLGEVWTASRQVRRFVPLLTQGTLTSAKVQGWKWRIRPEGAAYAGDKGAVTSNAARTESVEYAATRWAGAHDIDRAFVDFNVPGFWASYWQAMAASYKRYTDDQVHGAILGAAVDNTQDPGAGADVWDALVMGAAWLSDLGGETSFALLSQDFFTDLVKADPKLLLTGSLSIPGQQGETGGVRFFCDTGLDPSTVVMGDSNGATFYELGGGSPIRAEGVNIANGGVDVGAFGYFAIGTHDPLAFTLVNHSA